MGTQWVSQTIQTLRAAGFRVEAGYPARRAAAPHDAVAAVNILSMEQNEVRELLVTVLSPRALGLECCQNRAAEALRALTADGNQWRFSGWQFDREIDCWRVEIHGTPVAAAQSLPYSVSIGQVIVPYVTSFLAEQRLDRRMIYPHWAGAPSGAIPGKQGWTLKLTQLLPQSQTEPEPEAEPFSVTVRRGNQRVHYPRCYWQSYSSQQLPEGTQLLRQALALSREVTEDESNEV